MRDAIGAPRGASRLLGGLGAGMGIGAASRLLGIPSPAPIALSGALLVVTMTLGYVAADWWVRRDASRAEEER